jgi:hypothetical protein
MCTREGDASEMDSSSHTIAQNRVMASWNRAATKGKLMRRIIIAAAAALVVPSMATAQPKPATGCPQGELTRIRVSKIKPNGSMAGFRDAVAAHTRWYKAHGYRIEQRIAPVVTFARGRTGSAPQEVMTLATSDDVPREKHDAAWNAFVAKYRANSDIERETIVCMAGW